MAAHNGLAARGSATIHGHILAESVAIAYLGCGLLALEFEVLRNGTDHRAGKYPAVAAYADIIVDGSVGADVAAVADYYVCGDIAEGFNHYIPADLGVWVDV